MDRIGKDGIIAFITNRSLIDSRTFDGFRKTIQDDFDFAYIIDTKSDVRANPKIAGTTHNVFGIQTGVAVMFLVKHNVPQTKDSRCSIHYTAMDDFWTKDKKLRWLAEHPFKNINFQHITPDKNNNWINIADNDFESLISLANKATKIGKKGNAIFKLYSLGVVTARDEWVCDDSKSNLERKVKFLVAIYNKDVERLSGISKAIVKDKVDYTIKWTRAVKNDLVKGKKYSYDKKNIIFSLYRPFVSRSLYFNKALNEMQYQLNTVFNEGFGKNFVICFSGLSSSKPFQSLGTDKIFNHDLLEKTQCLPLYLYDKSGNRIDNVTDWGLKHFTTKYKTNKITKEEIFHYVYGVLHNPAYRKKYELNLKREFPRIPFYDNFNKWRDWGKKLMDLHINYETLKPFDLKVVTLTGNNGQKIKSKLKANKESGTIELDEITTISGIPKEAWEYKLGNRSALHWILDQYKEKKPKDPTIAEKFNTYRFADYKDEVIDLIKRVTTVSVETMRIIREMENE